MDDMKSLELRILVSVF